MKVFDPTNGQGEPLEYTKPQIKKNCPAFVTKIDEEKGIVTAIVNVTGVLDYGDDIIEAGAFTKTVVERARKIRVLDQHRTDSILSVIGKVLFAREIGRSQLPPEVLEAYPDATGGLETTTQYLLDTPEGEGAFKRIASGAVDEYSIGYDALDTEWVEKVVNGKKKTVRLIKSVRLWEYSPVIWGMNPATMTLDVKAKEDGQGESKYWNDEYGFYTPMLGTHLEACLHEAFSVAADNMLKYGLLERDERIALSNVISIALTSFKDAMPKSLYNRDLHSPKLVGDQLESANKESEGEETPTEGEASESKAGRMISDANAKSLKSAYQELGSVLQRAGLLESEDEKAKLPSDEKADDLEPVEEITLEDETPEAKADDSSGETQEDGTEAGPMKSPTLSKDALRINVEAQLLDIELLTA